jgi:hypothetical protein
MQSLPQCAGRGHRRAVRILAALAVATSQSFGGAHAWARDPLLPDLVPDPAEHLRMETDSSESLPRVLLRFDALIRNKGPGVLEVRGEHPKETPEGVIMSSVFQRVYREDRPQGPSQDIKRGPRPEIRYETTEGHSHFHLQNVARYRLLGAEGTSLEFSSEKPGAGFCLLDLERVDAPFGLRPFFTPERTGFCRTGNPTAPDVLMGIQPGYRDRYEGGLPFQWIDVSIAPPGRYWLITEPDPTDVIREANEANNIAGPAERVSVTVPGYRSRALYARGTSGIPQVIRLPADQFVAELPGAEAPGPAEFTITEGPKHGTLSKPVGKWSPNGTVVYEAEPGYTGTDTFVYAVRDRDHPYVPRFPVEAAVTVRSGLP